MVQPVITHRAVKSLDVGILLWVAWLDIPQRNPLLLCPALEFFADVFRAIVTADSGWFAPPLDYLLQRPFDSRGARMTASGYFTNSAILYPARLSGPLWKRKPLARQPSTKAPQFNFS